MRIIFSSDDYGNLVPAIREAVQKAGHECLYIGPGPGEEKDLYWYSDPMERLPFLRVQAYRWSRRDPRRVRRSQPRQCMLYNLARTDISRGPRLVVVVVGPSLFQVED